MAFAVTLLLKGCSELDYSAEIVITNTFSG